VKKFSYSEQMMDQALTTVVIYWLNPSRHKGYKKLRRFSIENKTHRQNGNIEPGMKYLYETFVKPNVGEFKWALFYLRSTNQCIRAINQYGQEDDPEPFRKGRYTEPSTLGQKIVTYY
jgi:hypothetical protein